MDLHTGLELILVVGVILAGIVIGYDILAVSFGEKTLLRIFYERLYTWLRQK